MAADPARYELHYEDETHVETNPYLGRVWHRVGAQPVLPVLDNGSCHTSKVSRQALAARAEWLDVVPLSRYSPELNPKEREWRWLKRDHRSHLAPTLRTFVDVLLAGLGHLGGERCDIVDAVPEWWLAGHRKEPTGHPPGRPHGAKDTRPRRSRCANKPALT